MASRIQQQRKKERESFIELMPEMLTSALSMNDDFIATFETHPDDGKQDLHVLRGKLITPCMMGTLKNRVEIQREEGSTMMTLPWGKSRGKRAGSRCL